MDPVTANTQQHVIKHSPQNTKGFPLRWHRVVAMHLDGMKDKDIALACGYTENSVYRILHLPQAQAIRQQSLGHTAQRLEAKFNKVVDVIDACLDDPEPAIRLSATDKWFKATGKYQPDKGTTINNFTAEDLVVQMLNGDNINGNKQ